MRLEQSAQEMIDEQLDEMASDVIEMIKAMNAEAEFWMQQAEIEREANRFVSAYLGKKPHKQCERCEKCSLYNKPFGECLWVGLRIEVPLYATGFRVLKSEEYGYVTMNQKEINQIMGPSKWEKE